MIRVNPFDSWRVSYETRHSLRAGPPSHGRVSSKTRHSLRAGPSSHGRVSSKTRHSLRAACYYWRVRVRVVPPLAAATDRRSLENTIAYVSEPPVPPR